MQPAGTLRIRLFGLGLLALCLGAAPTQAEQFTTELDPVCQLPRISLRQSAPDTLYELLAADDPSSPVWEHVLSLAPQGHDHAWHDPAARAAQRRFYRWQRIQPRPPLAPVDNFRLNDHTGASHEVLRDGDAALIVLAFTDNAGLAETWAQLAPARQAFGDGSVRFWLINPTDARGDLAPAAQSAGVTLPILHDAAQVVSRAFRVERAGEVVVLAPGNLEEVYRGAIQNRVEANGKSVEQDFLMDALTQARNGQSARVTLTRGQGRRLGLAPIAVPDYAKEVAPLLQQHCVKCHRPGDIGSFAMTSHAGVAQHAYALRANLLEGLMPPWHADAPKGTFVNDQSLAPGDVAKLVAWVDAGTPASAGPDPLVTHPPEPVVEWPLGTPDRILAIPRQVIPPVRLGKTIPYRWEVMFSPYPTDVWLKAAVVKPGNRKVVHHALVFAGTIQNLQELMGGLAGFFAGYVPGVEQGWYPVGTGKLLKRGSIIAFQMHYTPVEGEEEDVTQLGLYLSPTPPARELKTEAAFNRGFVIPPRAKALPVEAGKVFSKPVVVYEMSPHMHYRGASMRFDAELPDGTRVNLLNVPKYDFAWQAMYRLAEPKALPAGSRLVLKGTFDNSIWNPFNPNPEQSVRFGEQTEEEMFIGYVNYAEVAP
jgi:hypothetical protein